MAKLVLYQNTSRNEEYVVIITDDADPSDYASSGTEVKDIIDIDGDFSLWPADRTLRSE